MNDKWDKVYTEFAGIDFILIQNDKEIGTAQALAYTVNRKMAPIFKENGNEKELDRRKKDYSGSIIFNNKSPKNIYGPFDIKLLASDEKGNKKVMYIKGAKLTRNGKFNVDYKIGEQVTFIAKTVIEWEDYND